MIRDPTLLLKLATKKKKEGDLEGAIEILKKAYMEMEKQGMPPSPEEKIRLAMYLEKAGRNDEGWRELNKIGMEIGWPNSLREEIPAASVFSILYDKKRLFLQREGKHKYAVQMGVFSYLFWALSRYLLYMDSDLSIDIKDFKEYTSDENMEKYLLKLLKKAKKEDVLPQLMNIVRRQIKKMPNIDLTAAGKEVNLLMKGD